MSIEGLIGIGLMLMLAAVGILFPFFGSNAKRTSRLIEQLDLSREELITSYERVLSTLRDLEEDFKSHKINPEDYEQERGYWSRYGIQLLELLDDSSEDSVLDDNSVESEISVSDAELNQSVEQAILNYRVALQSVEKT
jgi:hypothetical protein